MAPRLETFSEDKILLINQAGRNYLFTVGKSGPLL